jgi:hypothetical protein
MVSKVLQDKFYHLGTYNMLNEQTMNLNLFEEKYQKIDDYMNSDLVLALV